MYYKFEKKMESKNMLMRRTRNNATFGYNKLYTHTQ